MKLALLSAVLILAGLVFGHSQTFTGSLMGEGFACETYDFETGKATGCKLAPNVSFTQAISGILEYHAKMQKESERCGQWAAWTLDQNDNVMYRVKNAPCPTTPLRKDYGNYCDKDLAAIGMGELPEGARPRTLGCKD